MSAESGLDIGRRVKAKRIAEAIRSLGGTADDARRLTEDDWVNATRIAAERTGRGYPKHGDQWKVPSEVTRALVIEYLSRPEAPQVDECPARDEDVPE